MLKLLGDCDQASLTKIIAVLAQSGEHSTVTAEVRGSKPLYRAKFIAESQGRGEPHKLFLEGSNPSSATKFIPE